MTYPIAPNGIFWTLQGEGALTGAPMLFVRLAGCSVGCAECDTEYRVDRRLTVAELRAEMLATIPAAFHDTRPWVWVTGGEPTDHNLKPLVDAIHDMGSPMALATAGTRFIEPNWRIEWVSVSAHSARPVLTFGHELKVVPGLNGLSWADVEHIDRNLHSFPYRFVQPLSEGGESLARCIEFVKTHPGWRLTTQAHKGWGLP